MCIQSKNDTGSIVIECVLFFNIKCLYIKLKGIIMKHLISAKTVRFLRIFEANYFASTVAIDSITEINNCSKNTVLSDLAEIYDTWHKILDIEVTQHYVSIKNIAMGDLINIKEIYYRQESAYVLLLNIFFYPNYSIYDHAIELNYSESHLRKSIIRINEFLSQAKAKIEYKKEGNESHPIIVAEDEVVFIHFMTGICMIAKVDLESYDTYSDEISVMEEIFKRLNLSLTTSMRDFLDNLQIISATRISQGFTTRDKLVLAYDKHYNCFEFSDFQRVYEKVLQNQLRDHFGEMYILEHKADFQMVVDVIVTMFLRIKISTKNVDDFLNRYEFFLKKYKMHNEAAYAAISDSFGEFKELLGKDFEDYYAEIMFNLYIHVINVRPKHKFKIGVYSDMGVSHASSMLFLVRTFFPIHDLEVFTPAHDYDLVLSTQQNIPELEGQNITLISDLPGVDDFKLIYNAIRGLQTRAHSI